MATVNALHNQQLLLMGQCWCLLYWLNEFIQCNLKIACCYEYTYFGVVVFYVNPHLVQCVVLIGSVLVFLTIRKCGKPYGKCSKFA